LADLVLVNGKIHTMDRELPQATAVAVRGDRVLCVGCDDEVEGLLRSGGKAIDLKGQCVVPGMIDAHLHFESFSLGMRRIDAETGSVEELLERVGKRVAEQEKESWILGFGWNQHAWGGAFPTKEMLDGVAPEHPVFLRAKSGHAGWANSAAMRIAGVDRSTGDMDGGALVRDGEGEPTGIFLEDAQGLIGAHIPEPSLEEAVAAMREGQERALAQGLTGVHDLDGARALKSWQILRERGEIRLRVCKSVPGALLEQALAVGIRSGLGDEWLRIGGVKLFADGALGPRTAWMIEPYEGEAEERGIATADMEEMGDMVRRASMGGLASFVHAIGDRANREVLDIFAAVREEECAQEEGHLRHRIEHAQLLQADDWGRLAGLGVIGSMQPIHATSDMEIVDRYWGERGRGAYHFRTLLERGTALAFGSDCPVERMAPLVGIHAAVTRRRADGTPGEEGWYPEQRLSVEEAVRGFTLGAAFASGEEGIKGSLSPGKLADLVVLDRDIFAISPMDILEAQVEGTMIGGKWGFGGEGFGCGD
jgi:predicted amidohydrolase YtcJ